MGNAALGHLQADLDHCLFEFLAVFGGCDGFSIGTDEFGSSWHTNEAAPVQRHRQVEGSLATERRQDRVGALAFDDGCEHFYRERLNVGAVSEVGVGHDRGRVRVRQNHPIALGPQHSTGLRARVVKLARLSDDDRPRTNHQDAVQIVAPWHDYLAPCMSSANRAKRYRESCGPGPASG